MQMLVTFQLGLGKEKKLELMKMYGGKWSETDSNFLKKIFHCDLT